MKRFPLLLMLGAVLSGALPRLLGAVAQEGRTLKTVPFETLGLGTQSGCTRPAKLIVTNEVDWKRVWRVHLSGKVPSRALPAVDFSHQVVLAVLGGRMMPGSDARIGQIVKRKTETQVYYYVQPGQGDISGRASVQPFHFAVIEKPSTPLHWMDALGATCIDCEE